MRQRDFLKRLVALPVLCCVAAFTQTLGQDGTAVRRALIVVNTYANNAKMPRPPVDESGAKALEDVLRDARFEVTVKPNLDLGSLIDDLDKFQLSIQPGDVSFFYYSGYVIQDRDRNYLVPADFDPVSNGEIYDAAYDLARLERGLAAKNPFVSMLVLDASWGATELRIAGLSQPTPSAQSWIFASAGPNQITTQTNEKIGLFTAALVRTLPQHGLDLTDIVMKVKGDVEAASQGTQHPDSWTGAPPRFFFYPPNPRVGSERQNGKDRLMYVYIPPGRFWMGCAPASEAKCKPEEKPRHFVEITKGYYLGQTEVTNQAYYHRFPQHKGKPKAKEGDIPVVDVSWEDAQKYCQWAAKGGRLPTEAEWEYAARGGKENEVYPYGDFGISRDKANFLGVGGNDKFDGIAPVKQFDPNGYNLFDMAGNVWEWVQDWFSADYYFSCKESPVHDPKGPAEADKGKKHVVRGGSWASDAKLQLRLSYRESGNRTNTVGFRCLLPDTPEVTAGFRNPRETQ